MSKESKLEVPLAAIKGEPFFYFRVGPHLQVRHREEGEEGEERGREGFKRWACSHCQ